LNAVRREIERPRQEHRHRETNDKEDDRKRGNPLWQEQLLDDGDDDLRNAPGNGNVDRRRLHDLALTKFRKKRTFGHRLGFQGADKLLILQ
jgi:hypothetical protein